MSDAWKDLGAQPAREKAKRRRPKPNRNALTATGRRPYEPPRPTYRPPGPRETPADVSQIIARLRANLEAETAERRRKAWEDR